ncbi:MAG TPA: PKD domain-containing protein, partial [Motiliproteus sp.]
DLFYFDADSGPLTLSVTPAWDAFTRTLRRGANLDIKATLLDQNGTTVASSDPNDDTLASLTINLQQGRYYLAIEGVGNSQTPYSNYASLGQYFISGQFPPSGTQVNLPPSAAFSVSCDGFNCNFSDNSYDSDGTIVAWQWDFADDTRSTLTNPSHTYTAPGNYTVVLWVTDDQGLQSSAQQQVSISDPNAVPPSMPTALLTTDNANGSASISWNGDATATSYEIQRETRHPKNGRWTSTTLLGSVTAPLTTLTDSSGTGTFRYSVRALNSYGVSGWSSWSQITVSDSTGGGSGGGGGGKCSPRKNSC